MHAHYDPVDITIAARGSYLVLKPDLLSAGRIAPDVGVAGVLVFLEICVTEIAVEEVEQRSQPFNAERGIARRRRAKIVIDIRGGATVPPVGNTYFLPSVGVP